MSPPADRDDEIPLTYKPLNAVGRIPGPPMSERAHDRVNPARLSGSIDLRITTIDPLHIGSGATNFIYSGNQPELARDIIIQKVGKLEIPVIPGSSLKGAVRNLAEALGGGCDLNDKACDPACAVCAIFGHLLRDGGYLGRAGFDDALPEDPAKAADRIGTVRGPMPFQPRAMKGRRIYPPNPRSFSPVVPYVVVDRDISFRTKLHLHNLTLAEAGLVLLATGADGSFRLRVGGGKFANLGRIRVEAQGATLRRGYRDPAPERLDAAKAKAQVEAAIAAFQLSDRASLVLKTLRDTLGGGP